MRLEVGWGNGSFPAEADTSLRRTAERRSMTPRSIAGVADAATWMAETRRNR